MATQNNIVQKVKFYEYRNTSMWLAVVYNNQWKKYSIHLTRTFSYMKDGETKQGSNTIFLPLSAAAALIGQLVPAYQYSKQLEEENSMEFYKFYQIYH